ncbi:MAG: peptidoglycan bridge formation glycyltransferase FemA/FemB family protein [Leptolinea sp.]|nr:peptidoglycan bridge formation glycyltransferase FemA/FemB family protein [Leptolinea sp.]
MPVIRISPQDPRWLDFIQSHPNAMIFHHPNWMKNLEDTYQYKTFVAVLEDTGNKITAGVPMAEVNSRLTGNRWVSLPFSDYCIPLSYRAEDIEILTDGLINIKHEAGIPRIELRWEYPPRPEITTSSQNVFHIGSFHRKTEEELLAQFNKKVRYSIRTTIERGVRVEEGTSEDSLREFYRLHSFTRRRHGVPVQPWKYFTNLGKNVLEKGFGGVLLAYLGKDCIAGLVYLKYGQTVTIKYSASGDVDLTNLHPNYLLNWETIRRGNAAGYQRYDFGRSDINNSGLRNFKNQWKYEEKPLTYSYLGCEPREESRFMDLAAIVLRRSPMWVSQIIGELLYRHVG